MAWGGKRPNSGKKKGTKAAHTLQAEQARKRLISLLKKHWTPIVNKAIEQAKGGDRYARDWLSDRAFGKSPQPLTGEDGGPIEHEHSVIYLPQRGESSVATKSRTAK